MTSYFYMFGRLHTEASLISARTHYAVRGSKPPWYPVMFNDIKKDAIGCVMLHTLTNKPLAGRPRDGAQLSHTLPPRMYAAEEAALLAIMTIGVWGLDEFQVKWVHKNG